MSAYTISVGLDATGVDLPIAETDLLGANGIDVAQADSVVLDVENKDATNVIDALTVYELPQGATKWVKRTDVTFGPIAASSGGYVAVTVLAHGRLRLTATPTHHVSADAHARLVRKEL